MELLLTITLLALIIWFVVRRRRARRNAEVLRLQEQWIEDAGKGWNQKPQPFRSTSPEKPASVALPRATNLAVPVRDGLDYEIEYADVDGVVTQRSIQLVAVEGTVGATYIRAFCRLRHAERTFRADRILRARSPSTGIIDDPETHFFQMLPEDERPDADHAAVMSRVMGGLDVLVWIANADREITMDEKEALLDFISVRNGIAGQKYAAIPWSKAKATLYIEMARPTLATCSTYLGRLSRTGKEYALTKRYAEIVAGFGGAAGAKRYRQLFR
jgi:WYL domain